MRGDDETNHFLRQEDALALLRSVEDRRTQDLATAALTALWQESQGGTRPAADFDLVFFIEVLVAFCSKHDLIARILDGSYEGWPE